MTKNKLVGFVIDCNPEEYQQIKNAAGSEEKMSEFVLLAAMREVSYMKGMDQLYLDEYAQTEECRTP